MNRGRGFSLGAALLVVMIVSLLGVTIAGMSVTHQGLLLHSENSTRARNAARSLIERAMAGIFDGSLAPDATLTDQGTGYEAVLTFDPSEADARQIPVSINNLEGSNSVKNPNNGGLVPAATARLVAWSRYRGQVHQVEVLLYVPPYPYALACAGPLDAPTGVIVGELMDYAVSGPLENLPLAPADLGSGSVASNAVLLGGRSRVTGNVETPGQIVLQDQAVIDGERRGGWGDVPIPALDPTDYDPLTRGLTTLPLPAAGTPLTQVYRETGDRTVDSLDLQNGFVYIEGNLTVNNGVTGQGVLVTTGALTINGGTDIRQSLLDLALVSGGKTTLTGAGPETSAFHGVVYAGGGLEARRIAVVGTLIANNAAVPVSLEEVAVFEKPGEEGPKPGLAQLGVTRGPLYLGTQHALAKAISVQDYSGVWTTQGTPSNALLKFEATPVLVSGQVTYDYTLTTLTTPALVLSGRGRNALSGDIGVTSGQMNPFRQAFGLQNGNVGRYGLSTLLTYLDEFAAGVDTGDEPPVNPALILEDLSKILRLADRVRVLEWVER
ncbi:MAG: hypothetical protein AB7S38_07695 [Vulcanimicrobiota bacterium]